MKIYNFAHVKYLIENFVNFFPDLFEQDLNN